MPKLESFIGSAILVIVISTLLFVLPHLIYKNKLQLATLTFFAGLAWAEHIIFFPIY